MVLRGLDAAQFRLGSAAVTFISSTGLPWRSAGKPPAALSPAFVSDGNGANVAASVRVTALNTCCVVELTRQQRRFNNWRKTFDAKQNAQLTVFFFFFTDCIRRRSLRNNTAFVANICPVLLQSVWLAIKTAAHCTPGHLDYTLGTTLVFVL